MHRDALHLCLLCNIPEWQERRSDGEQRSVPVFRLQIGTGAQTFDEFLDDTPPSLQRNNNTFDAEHLEQFALANVELFAHID